MISFSSHEIKFRFKTKAQVCKWLELFAAEAGFTVDSLSIVFCSDEFLLKMNCDYLSHDYFTDIITFDYSERQKLSGELFISIDRVRENAHDRGLLFDNELIRVLAHGVLHLMGLKDKTKKESMVMRNAEERAIKLFTERFAVNLD